MSLLPTDPDTSHATPITAVNFAERAASPEKLELISLVDTINLHGIWQLIGMAKVLAIKFPIKKEPCSVIRFPLAKGETK
jgi:hypothetical protein